MSIILKSIIEICVGSIVISLTVAGWIALLLCFCKWIDKKYGTETERPTTDKTHEEQVKKMKQTIRKMLKNEYGLIPIVNRPKEESGETDAEKQFQESIETARQAGVSEEKILKTPEEIDTYFTE